MPARVILTLTAVLVAALAQESAWQEGESLFDDPPAQDWKEGESLFDDAPAGESLMDVDMPPPNPNEIAFGEGTGLTLTSDIAFDEQGNVKEGGSTDPDIAFWSVAEFNGERVVEPTHGSKALLDAIENGLSYVVKFTPPDLSKVKCTEKVELLSIVLQRDYHDMDETMVQKALSTLAEEGVMNTKQLGDLWEKDYDAIKIPALIKSRLRIPREEAQRQAATAANKVEMDSPEVQEELRSFMAARITSTGGQNQTEAPAAQQAQAVQQSAAPPVEETEEDGTFKSLVWAIMNCPTCKGKETISCLRNCRYDALGTGKPPGTWNECLDQCITNRWIRATFSALLPKQ